MSGGYPVIGSDHHPAQRLLLPHPWAERRRRDHEMNLQWWQLELKLTGSPYDCSMHTPYDRREGRGN